MIFTAGWKPKLRLAQGSALGVLHSKAKRPVRAKAFIIVMLLPLQGALFGFVSVYPGRCPGLGASAPSGRTTWGTRGKLLDFSLFTFHFSLKLPFHLDSTL